MLFIHLFIFLAFLFFEKQNAVFIFNILFNVLFYFPSLSTTLRNKKYIFQEAPAFLEIPGCLYCSPIGIRTRVSSVKGKRPRPG